MKRSNVTQAIVRGAYRHPYVWAAVICLAINPFFLGSYENIPSNAMYIENLLVLAAAGAFGIYRYCKGAIDKVSLGVYLVCACIADFGLLKQYSKSENKPLWHFIGGCAVVLILYLSADRKKYREQLNSWLIMGLGFCLKLHYIVITSVYTRQHDIHSFGGDTGHAGYMEYLLFNHKLPDFDVRERWQFCHPPLHHTISALWIHINENILQVGHNPARESLQTLTIFYSMCIMISAYKLMRYFKLKGKALYIPLILVNFHPAFILFSGSINNDVLSVALVMGAIVSTLEWYKEPTLKKIMPIALCIGCAMMTKLSAALIAPPVALVFLLALKKNFKEKGVELFKQFVCFGLVCIPLGMWFPVRNYVKWEIPMNYVHEITTRSMQYIGDQRFFDRATDFSPEQWASPFEQWATKNDDGIIEGYNEYNPLITMMKNSMFSEYINENSFKTQFGANVGLILFWLNMIIAAAALIAIAVIFVKRTNLEKGFLVSFYAILMGSFYANSKNYPFTCTMNFRYITPTVIIGALFLGLAMKELRKRPKWGDTIVNVAVECSLIFAVGVTVLYLGLYIPK